MAQTAVRILVRAGVRRAYTVAGESFLDVLDAIRTEAGIRLVFARHETGAAFMAEADGKLNDTPALLLGSRGPGMTGLLVGVHSAWQDETPMVVLLESRRAHPDGVPEPEPTALFDPLAVWSARAENVEEIPGLLVDAVRAAGSGRRGPAVLSAPADVWAAPFDESVPVPEPEAAQDGTLARPVDAIAQFIGEARHPVVIAGGRAREARAQLLAAADELGLAVYNAFRRQDTFPENHARYAGHLGIGIPDRQLDALERADLVMVLGATLDEVTTQGYRLPTPAQTVVLVGTGLGRTQRRGLTFQVESEVEPFLRELREVATPRTRHVSAANAAVHTFMTPPDTTQNPHIHPAEVVCTVRRLAPEDTIVTSDAGNIAEFVQRYWCFTAARSQLGPCDRGRGYAVPAAIAAKLSEPDRAVVAMVGDGAALMTGQEVETAVRCRAPIIVIVFQNGVYGTVATHQAIIRRTLSGVTVDPVDFAGWARSLGAAGYTVDHRDELESAVANALLRQRPCVIDVRTDPDVVSPDVRLSRLLGLP